MPVLEHEQKTGTRLADKNKAKSYLKRNNARMIDEVAADLVSKVNK